LIVRLRQKQRAAETGLESLLNETKRNYVSHFMTETNHGSVAISERLKQLEAAVSRFCEKEGTHNPVQQIETPTARLSPFVAAGSIEFRDGYTRRTAAQSYASKEGFREAINRVLKRYGLLGRIVMMPELDWDGLKQGLREGSLTPEQIEPLGMIWTGGKKTKIVSRRKV